MQTPMIVSLNKAAQLTGRAKKTILRDEANGAITRFPDANGHPGFQIVDLRALYGEFKPQPPETGSGAVSGRNGSARKPADETGSETVSGRDDPGAKPVQETGIYKGLEAALEAKNETIATLKAQIEDLQRERDRWHTAYDQVKMLPAPSTPANVPAVIDAGAAANENRGRGGFFSRLFGSRA